MKAEIRIMNLIENRLPFLLPVLSLLLICTYPLPGKGMDDDTKVKFLWRENIYSEELNDTVSTIVIDTAYCSSISDPQRAALAYVATFVGNECWWDGNATRDRSNLKCKILTALRLGYQCSDLHLGFLRRWFRDDSKVLVKLEDCPTTPFTATVQETFDSINISVSDDVIIVEFSVTGFNIREDLDWHRKEEITFRCYADKLIIEKEFTEH